MKLILYLNGKLADTDNDSLVLMNYLREDLESPATVQNSYSQTVTLPATQRNNDIFSHFYRADFKASAATWDVLARVPFQVRNEMNEILESGYAKLNAVKKAGRGVASYEVTLYGGLGEFFFNLMYDEDGNEKNCGSLKYRDTNTNTWAKAEDVDLTITAARIKQFWAALPSSGVQVSWAQEINFVPCYNGKPSDFDTKKCYYAEGSTQAQKFANIPMSYGDEYGPLTTGVLLECSNDHNEWEVGDLRAYLQRPALRLKALIEAICNPENNGGYDVTLDSAFFAGSNEWYQNGWITMPLLDRSKISSNVITMQDALSGSKSPAEYLISLAKMMGLVFMYDHSRKVVSILTRNSFYNYQSSTAINIADRIDQTFEGVNEPYLFSERWEVFSLEDDSEFGSEYKSNYGKTYGSIWANTGYPFSADQSEVLKDVAYKCAPDVLERSVNYSAWTGDADPQTYQWLNQSFKFAKTETVKYKLYNEEGEEHEMTPTDLGRDHLNWGYVAGYQTGDDWLPKMQMHASNNSAGEGAHILCFFTGLKSVPTYTSLARGTVVCQMHLSDDNSDMLNLNDSVPCFDASLVGSTIAVLTSVPCFRRSIYNASSSRYTHSWEMSAPRELGVYGEHAVQGYNAFLYEAFWKGYIEERFSAETRRVTRRVDLSGMIIGQGLLRRFYWFENALWVLNAINDYNVTGDGLTECEFIRVGSKAAYTSSQTIPPATPTTELRVTPSSLEYVKEGATKSLTIQSARNWSVSLPAWASASQSSGSGNATISITAAANTQGARSGNIVVQETGGSSAIIAISQEAGQAGTWTYELVITPTTTAFTAAGGFENLENKIVGKTYLNGALQSSEVLTAAQLTITQQGDGAISRTGLMFEAAPLGTTETPAKSDAFTFAWNTATQTVTFTQAANTKVYGDWSYYADAGTAQNVPYAGDSQSVQMSAYRYRSVSWSSGSPATQETEDLTGTLTTAASGVSIPSTISGTQAVIVAVGQNPSAAQRTITLTLVVGDITKTCSFTQAGNVTSYGIEIKNGSSVVSEVTLGAGGGSITPTIYGITYQGGSETQRVQLTAAQLTINHSGDNAISRSGLTFSADSLGTTETAGTTDTYTFGWNGVSAALAIKQAANTSSYGDWETVTSLSAATTQIGLSGGTLNMTASSIEQRDITWSSGASGGSETRDKSTNITAEPAVVTFRSGGIRTQWVTGANQAIEVVFPSTSSRREVVVTLGTATITFVQSVTLGAPASFQSSSFTPHAVGAGTIPSAQCPIDAITWGLYSSYDASSLSYSVKPVDANGNHYGGTSYALMVRMYDHNPSTEYDTAIGESWILSDANGVFSGSLSAAGGNFGGGLWLSVRMLYNNVYYYFKLNALAGATSTTFSPQNI